jgi:hypothetical protein
MNIFSGIVLGQLLFYVSLRYWDSFIYMYIVFLAYALYVIFIALRKTNFLKKRKQIHKWLFPIIITCLVEALFFFTMITLVKNEIIEGWILFVWMMWGTRIFFTIPLTILICFITLKRI